MVFPETEERDSDPSPLLSINWVSARKPRHDRNATISVLVFGMAAFLADTKKKPCCWRTRMTSVEPSRLGIHHLLANRNFADRSIVAAGLAFKVEFDRLFQIGHGLVPGTAEAGHLDIE